MIARFADGPLAGSRCPVPDDSSYIVCHIGSGTESYVVYRAGAQQGFTHRLFYAMTSAEVEGYTGDYDHDADRYRYQYRQALKSVDALELTPADRELLRGMRIGL